MNSRIWPKLCRKGARFTALLLAVTRALVSVTAAFAEENGEEAAADVVTEEKVEEVMSVEAEAEEVAAKVEAEVEEKIAEAEEKEALAAEETDSADVVEDEAETQEVVLDDAVEYMESEIGEEDTAETDSEAEDPEEETIEGCQRRLVRRSPMLLLRVWNLHLPQCHRKRLQPREPVGIISLGR